MNRRDALLGLAGTSTVAAAGFASAQLASAQVATAKEITGTNLRVLLLSNGASIGTFDIKRFAAVNNGLAAIGTITATNGTKTVVSTLAVPVNTVTQTSNTSASAAAQQNCPILHLDIGPINLNLLGLVVTTEPIVLDIVAVPGAGNLLGNLLCAIAGLLNPDGSVQGILTQLVGALNLLLAAL